MHQAAKSTGEHQRLPANVRNEKRLAKRLNQRLEQSTCTNTDEQEMEEA